MVTNETQGGVRSLLRLEGAALLAVALVLYAQAGAAWTMFAAFFLAPDLAFVFYLAGPRLGAFAYNVTHSTLGPLSLAFASQLDLAKFGAPHSAFLLAVSLIWLAHVGFDRALGYGLKYASGFSDTHLGRIGWKRKAHA